LINKIAEKFDNKELRLRKQIENENDSKNKIELCTKYLNDFPDEDEIVRKIKAIAYYSINEFDKSYKEFERLLKQNNDYEYLKYKGLCLKTKIRIL
jgi:tetratricopeptide (TPR) repeat protein